jgi:hypothetical protein
MRMLVAPLVIVALPLAVAHFPMATPPQLERITDPEAYAVYAAILPREWTHVSKDPLLLQQETDTVIACHSGSPPGEIGWAAVENSFNAENARVRVLRRLLPIDLPYRLIPRVEIAADDARLAVKYPGTWQRRPESIEYVAVSAVGFNATQTKAIVYMHLRDRGGVYWIEKRQGKWDPTPRGGCRWIA